MIPFSRRHLGPSTAEAAEMALTLGCPKVEDLIDQVVPSGIRKRDPLNLPPALSEEHALLRLKGHMSQNKVLRSFIGLGYHDTFTPPVIQRNIFENPGWYTAYTPYQAEISQGRLEALLNYQTMICDLTGLDVSNSSLLDEGSAAAEACALALNQNPKKKSIFVSDKVHAHVLDVVITRMEPLGIEVTSGDILSIDSTNAEPYAALIAAYPDTLGHIHDFSSLAETIHIAGGLLIVCADLLALTLLKPPGEFGADICVGNSQRFGVPLGFGGPHAAFMAVKDPLKRRMPGRLVGVSKDSHGNPGYRLSLQTREQHIRREKATSNICTAQVLLAVMASMYAVYHGPEGLKSIATHVHQSAHTLAEALKKAGFKIHSESYFDTLTINVDDAQLVLTRALALGLNFRQNSPTQITLALDERVTNDELTQILKAFDIDAKPQNLAFSPYPLAFQRDSAFLTHPVFNTHHTETGMMRYLRHLEHQDIALNRSMIPLGSCTMKLNAAAEMMPLSWPEISRLHPFVPADQSTGYRLMFAELEQWLAECTGFAATSLQPNAGSQGEYAGLLAIYHYHRARGEHHRNICLIPVSAHGTNPASAVMVGMKVVPVICDDMGNIDVTDLKSKAEANAANLAALMVTYPSTHGVFEETITEICQIIHRHGGQVYMDGANMNAQVGLTSPGLIGADVCHLNLHKTFCIPHGGGGPGVGPICVAQHLVPYLPGHSELPNPSGATTSAPWGSASICNISWMYLAMMGPEVVQSSELAILNANYIAQRLSPYFPVLYTGRNNRVAHECILDFRQFKTITVEDIAKRLIDYGFHAPTMSWPVGGTLMIEPTESETRAELDRFCDAMISIHSEIESVETGLIDAVDNPLKNAPHTAASLLTETWTHPYTREDAAYPLPWVKLDKYWPPVGRIDNVHGDRHLICTCESVEAYATQAP
ncbi:aminomethyl-transferring glycine dehydrogenase [Phragmitibacter flavus]|uniref:Glycine dehydrogenase (decarboxylating) n=1 Tax=Phragmitibacter flavus TaxID=2576071 RepID=A0A5R8KEB9_9BACT|nr:aminomethyl-transferring glycine dehydrogenase [Phragmitibacter flavus]TLD70305.1 aminomethyl-transferring glycine dehydrogenase [Phragmitibacter flavus]